MQQRNFTIAVLASAAFFALSTAAGSQVIVSGNDEKVLWDDVGQAVFSGPGKDTISFVDIGDRENPKILTSIALENSIFGPPTDVAISPNGEIALVANSVTQTKDGEKWKPVPGNKVYIFDLKATPPKQIGTSRLANNHQGSTSVRKVTSRWSRTARTIRSAS